MSLRSRRCWTKCAALSQPSTDDCWSCLLRERDRELICLSVHPKPEAAAREPARTEGDAIWPHNVIGHQGKAVHSIQATLLYFGLFTPVCPVHEAKEDKEQFKKQKKQGFWSDKISNPRFAYLLMGSTTMARGFSRFSVINVFRLLPSVVATEMVFKSLSVQ